MRVFIVSVAFALLIAPQVSHAEDRAAPAAPDAKASTARTYSAEESAAMAQTARRKAEAQERIWDLKMKSIANGICTGC